MANNTIYEFASISALSFVGCVSFCFLRHASRAKELHAGVGNPTHGIIVSAEVAGFEGADPVEFEFHAFAFLVRFGFIHSFIASTTGSNGLFEYPM